MTKEETKKNKIYKGFSGPFVFIVVGIVLLLNNFGLISWEVWETLIRFWPVLFILWGLDIISGTNWLFNTIFSIFGILILLFVTVYSISLVDNNFDRWLIRQWPDWNKIKNIIPQPKVKYPSGNYRYFMWDEGEIRYR